MNRRTHVVNEPRKRQLCGARAAADRPIRFEDDHFPAGAGEDDGGREAVRPRPDHHGIRVACHDDPILPSRTPRMQR